MKGESDLEFGCYTQQSLAALHLSVKQPGRWTLKDFSPAACDTRLIIFLMSLFFNSLSGNVILGNIFPGLIRLKSIILKQADNVNEGMKTHAVGRRKTEVIFKLYSCV